MKNVLLMMTTTSSNDDDYDEDKDVDYNDNDDSNRDRTQLPFLLTVQLSTHSLSGRSPIYMSISYFLYSLQSSERLQGHQKVLSWPTVLLYLHHNLFIPLLSKNMVSQSVHSVYTVCQWVFKKRIS